MMDSAERHYFLERAEAELDLANEATHERAARAHYFLAGFYLDRAHAIPAASRPPKSRRTPWRAPAPSGRS